MSYKIVEKDLRVAFVLSEKQDREIYEAAESSDEVGKLQGEDRIVKIQALHAGAVKVLKGFHEKKMAGRLAQWRTTCRLDGCKKQPRSGGKGQFGHKAHRRNYVFCKGHAGIKGMVSKADYRRLQNNTNLRVVAS